MPFWTKDLTDDILRRHLDADFWVASAGENAPTRKELTRIAQRFDCKLPEEFLIHSTGKLAGVYVEVKADVWPRPQEYETGPFWSFLYAVFVYGVNPDIPDWIA